MLNSGAEIDLAAFGQFHLSVMAAQAAIHDNVPQLDAGNVLMFRYFSHQLAWMTAFAVMTEIGMLASLRSANMLSVNIRRLQGGGGRGPASSD